MTYRYQAFGLQISSEIELPELFQGSSSASPDIRIELGPLPEHLPGTQPNSHRSFESSEGRLLVRLKDAGRILIEGGNKITFEEEEGLDPVTVRLALTNLGLGVLLHQRGYLALHASAIAIPNGAVLFCGHRRAGKSTLAAALRQRGWSLVGDDKAAIYLEANRPMVTPSFPQLRLWRQAIDQLDFFADGLEQIPQSEKYNIRLGEEFNRQALPLRAIYLLKPTETDEVSLHSLQGMKKFIALRQHTYAPYFLKGLGLLPAHFQLASIIAGQVPITEVRRPSQANRLGELIEQMEAEIRKLSV